MSEVATLMLSPQVVFADISRTRSSLSSWYCVGTSLCMILALACDLCSAGCAAAGGQERNVGHGRCPSSGGRGEEQKGTIVFNNQMSTCSIICVFERPPSFQSKAGGMSHRNLLSARDLCDHRHNQHAKSQHAPSSDAIVIVTCTQGNGCGACCSYHCA